MWSNGCSAARSSPGTPPRPRANASLSRVARQQARQHRRGVRGDLGRLSSRRSCRPPRRRTSGAMTMDIRVVPRAMIRITPFRLRPKVAVAGCHHDRRAHLLGRIHLRRFLRATSPPPPRSLISVSTASKRHLPRSRRSASAMSASCSRIMAPRSRRAGRVATRSSGLGRCRRSVATGPAYRSGGACSTWNLRFIPLRGGLTGQVTTSRRTIGAGRRVARAVRRKIPEAFVPTR